MRVDVFLVSVLNPIRYIFVSLVDLSRGKGETKIVAGADIRKHKSDGTIGPDRRLEFSSY